MSALSKTNRGRAPVRDPRASGSASEAALAAAVRRPRPASSTGNSLEAVDTAEPQPRDDENLRATDHIMEILREGRYRCKLLK